jgi:OOP family OmpA-OmpF porin
VKARVSIFCFFISLLIKLNVPQIMSQNLVPNSSFEDFIDFNTTNKTGWHKVQGTDTPDYFNLSDYSHRKVFEDYIGGTVPRTGNGFVGIFCYRVHPGRDIKNIREFIETPLVSELEKDSLYRVEVSLCLDKESNIAIKNYGMLFSNSSLQVNSDLKLSSLKPQIEFNSSYLDSIKSWITLQSFYRAGGSEKYLLIGNFKSDRNTMTRKIVPVVEKGKRRKWDLASGEKATYYYIDDVIIEKAEIIDKIPVIVHDKEEELIDTFNIEEIKVDTNIILENIFFEFNKWDLLPESYNEINKLYHLMNTNPTARIKLEGHTDNIGSYDFNLRLSLKRVESVAGYLIRNGISPDRIELAGYSYAYPLVSNDTEEGRKINRRVEFKIIEK